MAVVENMSFFDGDDGKRYYPFGTGAGERLQRELGLPALARLPIVPDLSAAGDGGRPLVVGDPAGAVAGAYGELGAVVVREVRRGWGWECWGSGLLRVSTKRQQRQQRHPPPSTHRHPPTPTHPHTHTLQVAKLRGAPGMFEVEGKVVRLRGV